MTPRRERTVVFLASGAGGTLRFLHRLIAHEVLPGWTIGAVVADRPCGALDYALAAGLPRAQVAYTRTHPEELTTKLVEADPTVMITNIHKILDPETVRRFNGKLLNLHYSLLPAFPGLIGEATVRAALDRGCTFTGATCHLVTPEVDAGPILTQAAVPMAPGDDPATVMDRVFRAGCLTLANALERWPRSDAPPRVTLHDDALFAPGLSFDYRPVTEAFWTSVRGNA